MTSNHTRFLAKTVLVKNKDIDQAYRILDRILKGEKVQVTVRRKRYYERPCELRTRISYERCKRIYNEDMQKKIEFVMRKNRADAFLR